MPIRDLENRTPRPPVIGKVRLGVFGSRPQQADTLIFTSVDKDVLGPLQEKYGGEVEEYTPQNSEDQEWRLVSGTDSLDFRFPFPNASENYDSNYELWGRSGLKRLCDGYDAQVFAADEKNIVQMTERSCVCKAQGTQECEPTTRLWLVLPYVPGVGVWELKTGSKWALYELHDTLKFLSTRLDGKMHMLPLRLLYIPKKMRYFDEKKQEQKTTTKRVLTVKLRVSLQELEGDIYQELPDAGYTKLAQAIEAGVPDEKVMAEAERMDKMEPEAAGVEGHPLSQDGPPSAPANTESFEHFLQALKDVAPPGEEKRAQNVALLVARDLVGVIALEGLRDHPQPVLDEVLDGVMKKLWPEHPHEET